MGARFELRHANLMAYVTSRSFGPPRSQWQDLHDFLFGFCYSPREFLIPEPFFGPWLEYVSNIAKKALNRLNEEKRRGENDIVSGVVVGQILEELRTELSDFSLFGLTIGRSEKLRRIAERFARLPFSAELLILIPDFFERRSNFEILDPIPAFSAALHAALDLPGMAFWTPNGASAFVPIQKLEEIRPELDEALYHLIDEIFERRHLRHRRRSYGAGKKLDDIIRSWAAKYQPKSRRLLHLSDLHFGTRHAAENQPLLDAELSNVVNTVDRVVITGDLLDSPKEEYFSHFSHFKGSLTRLSRGKEPISITGNHDQRWKGILGNQYEQVAKLKSCGVELDEDAEMVFIMLNSSVKGSFARGHVTPAQLKRVGADFNNLIKTRDDVERFLPVVLVHHHPFSFDVQPDTFLQKALAAVGLREESLLELKDAADLHRWCVDWNFPTILHGHKHKRRYVTRSVSNGDRSMNLTAIGCGTSLGAEGYPLSYNLLEWNSERQRWIASFYESVNGGAFREVGLSLSSEREATAA